MRFVASVDNDAKKDIQQHRKRRVTVRLNVFDCLDVNLKEQTFKLRLYMECAWLVNESECVRNGKDRLLEPAWKPKIYFANTRDEDVLSQWYDDMDKSYNADMRQWVIEEGFPAVARELKIEEFLKNKRVMCWRRKLLCTFKASLTDPARFRKFPFDTQIFDIEIKSDLTEKELQLGENTQRPSVSGGSDVEWVGVGRGSALLVFPGSALLSLSLFLSLCLSLSRKKMITLPFSISYAVLTHAIASRTTQKQAEHYHMDNEYFFNKTLPCITSSDKNAAGAKQPKLIFRITAKRDGTYYVNNFFQIVMYPVLVGCCAVSRLQDEHVLVVSSRFVSSRLVSSSLVS